VPEPAVSVIIIAFNAERYLAEAVQSVFAQTLDDWELIIVDDGSTDGTLDLARALVAGRHEQARVLQHSDGGNHGMSATRNRGLDAARGSFVAFLDADDVWLPEKLDRQVSILRAQPEAALTYGRALIWRAWAGAGEDDFFYGLGVEPDRLYAPPELFLRQLRNVDQTPTSSGAMMRLSFVREVGGFEPVFRAMFEDAAFFGKALLSASVYVSGQTTFKYRQHPESATAQSAAAGQDERARAQYLRWLARRLRHTTYAAEHKAVLTTLRQLQARRVKRAVKRVLGHRFRLA
jgi:glycosyltransferase involved in cell wall biosynthesis